MRRFANSAPLRLALGVFAAAVLPAWFAACNGSSGGTGETTCLSANAQCESDSQCCDGRSCLYTTQSDYGRCVDLASAGGDASRSDSGEEGRDGSPMGADASMPDASMGSMQQPDSGMGDEGDGGMMGPMGVMVAVRWTTGAISHCPGKSCQSANDCCSFDETCNGGACCVPAGNGCFASADCCNGLPCDPGTNACCVGIGQPCTTDDECCNTQEIDESVCGPDGTCTASDAGA